MAKRMTEIEFLDWSIKGRHQIQAEALHLVELMQRHTTANRDQKLRMRRLVGVAFALWRAVFLADRTSVVDVSFAASREFLKKVLVDNTITFSFDVTHREWTFRFYADAARQNLRRLKETWSRLTVDSYETSTEEWDNLLRSFVAAHGYMKAELEQPKVSAKAGKTVRKRRAN